MGNSNLVPPTGSPLDIPSSALPPQVRSPLDSRNVIFNHQCSLKPNNFAKLVNITPIIMVYGTYNYSYWAYKPTYNWAHLVGGGPTPLKNDGVRQLG